MGFGVPGSWNVGLLHSMSDKFVVIPLKLGVVPGEGCLWHIHCIVLND